MKTLLLLVLYAATLCAAPFPWPNGAKGAVTLSFDDGLPCGHQLVAPLLHSNGLHATFYLVIDSPNLRNRTEEWRAVAAMGHELGNHSLHHPCYRGKPGDLPWLAEEYNLATYSPRRWLGEMRVANFALELIDGRKARTFGNTCLNNYIGTGTNKVCLEELMPQLFVAARGQYRREFIDPRQPNYNNLGCRGADGKPFEEIHEWIEAAVKEGKWLFLMFHNVGDEAGPLKSDKREFAKLVDYLAANTNRIWTAPAVDVVAFLRSRPEEVTSDQ